VFTTDRPDGHWKRSSYSTPVNDCVEVMAGRENVHVRDSKGQHATELRFHLKTWTCLLGHLRSL
jgi:hypothetical protein